MDYEVFLVSRMREAYVHSEPSPDRATRAVHGGFVTSGRVVTAAALIMFAVFAAFVPEGDANIQPIALSLAVGVVIDAFIVRMALIPAVLVLFGDRTWAMPAWLDRVLPSFDVEGEGIAEELALADWPPEEAQLVIAGEGVRTSFTPEGAAGAEIRLGAGEVLVVTGGDAAERTALLLSLGGRAPAAAERLKVRGFVLPVRAAAVRAQSAYVSVRGTDAAAALADAIAGHPPLLMIDGLDAMGDPAEHTRARTALTATGAALVIAARDRASVADVLPAASIVRTLDLAAPAPAALAAER
jgi:RND superfamily putative drug exporter